MDEEEDKHLCIVCNETIYGLMNYVLHRKNFCSGKSYAADSSKLVINTDKDLSLDKSLRITNALEAEDPDSHKDDSQVQGRETSVPQEIVRETSLIQDSETSPFQSNDEGSRLLEGSDETSLQSITYQFNGQNSLESDFQVQCVDDRYVNEHDLLDKHSEKDWEKIPDDIREVVQGTREKLVEVSDSESKGMNCMTILNFDEMEKHNQEDMLSHSPVKSEYGLLSISIAGNSTQDAGGSNKKVRVKRKSWHLRLDGTQSKTKKKSAVAQSERKRMKSAKHLETAGPSVCEICNVQVRDYPEYDIHKIKQHMSEATEASKVCASENSYVEVKVEKDTEMQVDQTSKEEYKGQGEEGFKVDIDNTGNNKEGEDVNGFESDVYTCRYEPDKNFDCVKTRNSDCAERNNKTGEIDKYKGIHYCTVCDKMFASKHNLIQHLITPAHKNQAIGKEQEYFNLIKKYHTSVVQHSPFRCDVCSFYFKDHKYLEDHLRSRTHRKKVGNVHNVVCSLCDFTTVSSKLLITHVQSLSHVRKVEKQDQVCAIKIRKKTKGPRKQLICNICPTEFSKMTPNKSHFLTKEHISWKIAFEKGKLNPGSEQQAGLYETSHKIVDVSKKEIKNEETSYKQLDCYFNGAKLFQNEYESGIMKGMESKTVAEMTENAVSCIDTNELDGEYGSECINRDDSTGCSLIPLKNVSQTASQSSQIGYTGHTEKNDQSFSLKKVSTCKYCPFETKDYNEMRPHYMKEHVAMVKICEVCSFVFPHGKGYKLHVNSKDHQANIKKCENNLEGMFECHVCKKKFAEEGYCKFHTAYYHFHLNTEDDVLRENGNSITRVKYSDYLREVEKLPNNYILTCPECNSKIKKLNLLGHLRTHTGEKPFICNICTLEFYNSSSLRRHLLVHFDCLEKTCEICGEIFKGLTSYNVHMDIHRAKKTSSEKTNICHICGEAFYVKRQLRMHMKKHAAKDFKCDVPGCLWAFSNRHALKRHMLTHSDENPFICPTCGYSTKSQKYLKSHEKIHSKDKLLQCEHCPYQTIKTTHLRRHMRIHLGTRPYKCPYCSYACNTHDNIRKHILETTFHKGLKVYPCKLCNYATNCTKEFRTHLLTEHTEVSAEDLHGGSLAAFTGLFNKEEDIQTASEGMEIFPCKDRNSSRRKIRPEAKFPVKHE